MRNPPWPLMLCLGIVGGAIGTVGLAYLLAAIKIDEQFRSH